MRSPICSIAVVAIILALSIGSVRSQITPSRSMPLRPIMDTTVSPLPLANTQFAIEVFRGSGSLADEQAWQIRLHGLVELWRISSNSTIAFTAHHELTANPFSSIGFNPRTARWEEQILFHTRVDDDLMIAVGGFHRCKHDIDNNEPPDDDTSNVDYVPTRRAIILSGLTATASARWLPDLWLSAGVDWMPVSEDYRTPGGADPGSWRFMEGAFHARADYQLMLTSALGAKAMAWLSVPWFSARNSEGNLPFDARLEVAFTVKHRTSLDVVLALDHQFDEVVFLTPQPTTVLQLGLRLGGF